MLVPDLHRGTVLPPGLARVTTREAKACGTKLWTTAITNFTVTAGMPPVPLAEAHIGIKFDGRLERRSSTMRKVKLLFLVLVALMAFAAPALSD